MELRDYLNVLRTRWMIIALCLIVSGATAVVLNYAILKPQFSATAKVLVEPRTKTVIFMSEQPRNAPPVLDIGTYVKLVKSLKVGEMAAKAVGEPDPERVADRYSKMVQVVSEEDTGIIRLSVSGQNPQKCAEVANAYASAFVELSTGMASDSIKEVEDYIKDQLKIAIRLEKKQAQEVSRYKAEHNVIDPTLEADREEMIINSLEETLMRAQIDEKETEVKLVGFHELLNRYEDILSTNAPDNPGWERLQSGSDQNLDQRIQSLELDRLELVNRYVDNHPKIKQIDNQIKTLKEEKKRAVQDMLGDRRVEYSQYESAKNSIQELTLSNRLAKARINRINQSLLESEQEKKKFPQQEYELNKLKREHEVAEALVDMLNKQLLETQVQKAQRPTKVQVLDKAIVPVTPISPDRKKNGMILVLLGLFAGIGIAFLLEEMEKSVRTSDDVKNYLNLPVLGSIPYSAETINKLITDVPMKSPISEAYRRLSFFTQLFCLDPPIKCLLVTSSKSDEGKSTTLANMAISMAQEGTKVIIVDTDLRRPMLHRMFGCDNSLGLSSVLSGELEAELAVSDMASNGRLPKESFMDVVVDRIIQPSGIKGLGIVPSGPLPANSIELLRGERMLSFMRTIEKKADIVLFDSPPAIHVIDAVVLAQILDGVLMVINSGRIDRDEALQVKYMIESTKTPIIGVALNNIEAASPDYYYYYYYGGYGYGSRQRRKRVKLKR